MPSTVPGNTEDTLKILELKPCIIWSLTTSFKSPTPHFSSCYSFKSFQGYLMSMLPWNMELLLPGILFPLSFKQVSAHCKDPILVSSTLCSSIYKHIHKHTDRVIDTNTRTRTHIPHSQGSDYFLFCRFTVLPLKYYHTNFLLSVLLSLSSNRPNSLRARMIINSHFNPHSQAKLKE